MLMVSQSPLIVPYNMPVLSTISVECVRSGVRWRKKERRREREFGKHMKFDCIDTHLTVTYNMSVLSNISVEYE